MTRSWLKFTAIVFAVVLVLGAGLWLLVDALGSRWRGPDPTTVAAASLQGLREQNRLTTFAARYVAVVTSQQQRLGLSARKTLIMPGSVRYEVDLSKLQQSDLRWDANAKRLDVTIPPIEVVGPQVELDNMQEYDAGGLLMKLTDVESRLDTANRKAGQAELIRQARGPVPMKLARDATRRAVERSFAMPLKATGLEARVVVRFADEAKGPSEEWDRSRSVDDVLANRW